MKRKSIALNALLLSLKTVLSMVASLVTIPYITRVLLVDGVGKHNFAVSVVSYFVLLAELGIYTYAVREGTKLRDDRGRFSVFASEVFSIHLVSSVLAIALLAVCVLALVKLQEYWVLLLILSAEIPLTALSRSWVYSTYEDFGFMTLTQLVMQVLAIVLMLLFVKTPADLPVYTVTYVVSRAGAGLVFFIHSKKYVDFKPVNWSALKRHMKPILMIFFTAVSTTIYVNSDVTILGWLVDDTAVGLYSVSAKVYNIVKLVITSVVSVAIPQLTLRSGKEEFGPFFNKIFKVLSLIVLPAMTGLFLLSENVIGILAGDQYQAATTSMQILSIALGGALFSALFSSGVLIPYMREKTYMWATIISALTNIALNFILIPLFRQDAAAFTTLLSEFLMLAICYCVARKYVTVKGIGKTLLSIGVGCVAIVGVCLGVFILELTLFLETAVCVVGSVAAYSVVQLMLKNEVFTEGLRAMQKKLMKKGK